MTEEGEFQLNRGPHLLRVLWSDVREIAVYKRDLFATDEICLGLRVSDEDEWIELSEEDRGFMPFIDEMQVQFPSIPEGWYQKVMVPAFKPNHRVLWNRDGSLLPAAPVARKEATMNKGYRRGIVIAAIVVLVAELLAYPVAFFTVAPAFTAEIHRQPNGEYHIEIDPNFVVNNVYRVSVNAPHGLLAERKTPESGVQRMVIRERLPTGTMLTIECDLQYDRIAPCITTSSETVVVP